MRFRILMRAAFVAALAVTLTVPTVAGAATTRHARDNKLPGVSLQGPPQTGKVSVPDPWDIYRVTIPKNSTIRIGVSGTGGKVYAFLLPPYSKKIDPAKAAAVSVKTGSGHYPQVLRFATSDLTGGTYSVVVFGQGTYKLWYSVVPSDGDDDMPGVPLATPVATETPNVFAASGSLVARTDWSDVYRVELTKGQAISAEMWGPASCDFDLSGFRPGTESTFYRKAGSAVRPWPYNAAAYSAHGMGQYPERVLFEAPEDGAYFVKVSAFKGSGSYEMTATVLEPSTLSSVAWSRSGTVPAGTTVQATGTLLAADGSPLAGEKVWLLEERSGGSWVSVTDPVSTLEDGSFTISKRITKNSRLRVRYRGAFNAHAPVSSAVHDLKAQAKVGTPSAPSSVKKGRTFKINGSLYPAHATKSRAVALTFQHWENGRWVTKFTRKVKTKRVGNRSVYTYKTSLPSYSRWRVRAYHADRGHAKSVSSWERIRVR